MREGSAATIGAATSLVENFESTAGSGFADMIIGVGRLELTYGCDGKDILSTTSGGVSLYGGTSNDTLQASRASAERSHKICCSAEATRTDISSQMHLNPNPEVR